MLRNALLVTTILGLTLSTAMAMALDEKPLSISGLTQRSEQHYLNGVADGFQIMNAQFARRGSPRLFCIPGKVVLYGRDLLELASKDLRGPQEDVDVVVSALFGLMKKYPCQQQEGDEK